MEAQTTEGQPQTAAVLQAWKQASQHANLQFSQSIVSPQQIQTPYSDFEKMLEEMENLKDPILRPPGAIASETLKSVFTHMLRHSTSVVRSMEQLTQPPSRHSVGNLPGDAMELLPSSPCPRQQIGTSSLMRLLRAKARVPVKYQLCKLPLNVCLK